MSQKRLFPGGLAIDVKNYNQICKIETKTKSFVKNILKSFPNIDLIDLHYYITREIGVHFSVERNHRSQTKHKGKQK